MSTPFKKDTMFYRFSAYGFLKNLRFFEPFLILLFRDAGQSFTQIGLLYAIRDISTNVLEIPTGVFADVFGRRKSMVMAFAAYIAAFIVFYAFSNFYLFALAMVLFGAGEAFRSGTHKALILEYLKQNNLTHLKVDYYGYTRSASQMGSAVNSLIAAAIVFYTGNYRYMFLAATVPYVLDLFNLMTYPKELDGDLNPDRTRASISAQTKETLAAFGAMFKHSDALRAIGNSAGFMGFFKSTKDYLQPILQAYALALPLFVSLDDTRRSAVLIGLVYFVIYLLTSYASRHAAPFSRRFGNLGRAINGTFLLGGIFLLIAGLAAQEHWAIISIVVFLGFYILQNLRRPMNVGYISDQIASKVMASGLSVESQLTTILMAVLAPILGALADNFGVGAALAIFGAAMLALLAVVRVKSEKQEMDSAG